MEGSDYEMHLHHFLGRPEESNENHSSHCAVTFTLYNFVDSYWTENHFKPRIWWEF